MPEARTGELATIYGIVLCLLGTGLMLWAYFIFDISAPLSDPLAGQAVANLERMQQQTLAFQGGAALLILGGIFIAAGNIVTAIADASKA